MKWWDKKNTHEEEFDVQEEEGRTRGDYAREWLEDAPEDDKKYVDEWFKEDKPGKKKGLWKKKKSSSHIGEEIITEEADESKYNDIDGGEILPEERQSQKKGLRKRRRSNKSEKITTGHRKKKWWQKIGSFFTEDYTEEELEQEWESADVENWDWEVLVKDRDIFKIQDQEEREKYVRGCIEQVNNAADKLEEIAEEYSMVTSYLKDIEEIEALPDGEKTGLLDNARKIQVIEGARREYKEKKNRLLDWQFYHMQRFEDVMPKPYEDIKAAEEYRDLICTDLSRLEGEKHAYQFRKSELKHDMANAKGMITICFMAMIVCVIMLFVLQYGFEMDVQLGYILTIGAGASIVSLLYVKYLDWRGQLEKTQQGINKIVMMKNTVNIRYVNNTNLLDYLYTKYKVQSGKELLNRWERYQQERHERNAEEQNREDLDFYKKRMISILRRYQLHDADIWLYQTEALLEKKEMVEIRHNLIERRQKLRTQIDYNKRLMEEAKKEIERLIQEYPQYKDDILRLTNSNK